MKVQHHTGISLVIAAGLFAAFRSLSLSLAALLTGIFIDIDHTFDYLREYGFRPNIKFFFHVFDDTLFKRVVLIFHGWEWAILLAVLSMTSKHDPIISGIAIGLWSHLLCDQFTNGASIWGYSLIFRLSRKFEALKIFPGKGLPTGGREL